MGLKLKEMKREDAANILKRHNKFFVMFLLVLFFSLFSMSSFLLQSTSRSFISLVTNPHFIVRIAIVIFGLCSFIYVPHVSFFKSNMFFLTFLAISYFAVFSALVFSRHNMLQILGETIPIGFMVGISSVFVITNNVDKDSLELEDFFVYAFLEAFDVILLLLATDFTSAFIIFLTLTILSFHYGLTFALRVFLLNLLCIFMTIYFFLLSPSFVSKYFNGLLADKTFMEFFSNSSVYLASDRTNATIIASARGDIIFSFIKRFSVFGLSLFALVLLVLVGLSLLGSSYVDRCGEVKESIRMYALSIYMGFSIIFPILSLVTSLPIFRYDLPFVSMSNIYVYLNILVFAYLSTPLLELDMYPLENSVQDSLNSEVVDA